MWSGASTAMRTRPPLILITFTVMLFPMQMVSFNFLDSTNMFASFQSDLITNAPRVSSLDGAPSANCADSTSVFFPGLTARLLKKS